MDGWMSGRTDGPTLERMHGWLVGWMAWQKKLTLFRHYGKMKDETIISQNE